MFPSPVWRPYLVKDSAVLKKLQRRATKYILNYPCNMDYKNRLVNLHLLPITLLLEMQDILFFIKLLKFPPDNFSLSEFITFIDSNTCSSSLWKIKSVYTSLPKLSTTSHFYFYRIVRLWNSLPPLDLDLSFPSLKHAVYNLYWNYFISHFDISLSCSWYRVCPCTNCYSIPISSSI